MAVLWGVLWGVKLWGRVTCRRPPRGNQVWEAVGAPKLVALHHACDIIISSRYLSREGPSDLVLSKGQHN